MSVNSYIQTLLLNDAVREQVLKHAATLERILSHEACVLIRQIGFDLDIMEVSNGYAFTISKRSFAQFDVTSFRGRSARAFVPYNHTSPPEPGLRRGFQHWPSVRTPLTTWLCRVVYVFLWFLYLSLQIHHIGLTLYVLVFMWNQNINLRGLMPFVLSL